MIKDIDKSISSKKTIKYGSFLMLVFIAVVDQLSNYKATEYIFYTFAVMGGGESILLLISGNLKFKNQIPEK